jgi:hypoxanthine phosphoribosyltransferase
MKTVQVRDRTFALYIEEDKIREAIHRIAREIDNEMMNKDPLFLVILNGAFMFAAELFKKLSANCEISFVKLASYRGTESTEEVKELIGVGDEIKSRHIIIVEDIIDTGITLEKLQKTLQNYEPASIHLATMLFKPDAFQKEYEIRYIGMEIPNDFVIGYGLDYNGHGRNLPDIYKVVE